MSSEEDGGNAMYAAVDMGKCRSAGKEADNEADNEYPNLPMYAVVDKKKKSSPAKIFDDIDVGEKDQAPSIPLTVVNSKSSTEVRKLTVIVVLLATILGVVTFISIVISVVAITEISGLKLDVSVPQEALNATTNSSSLDQEELLGILHSLPPGRYEFFPIQTCAALPPSSPSDYYWVRASNGSAVRVYCDMTRSCGGVTGGWMRVVELDVTNSSHQCPSGLVLNTDSNIRTCRRMEESSGCSSFFSTAVIPYSGICGRVIAYQVGTTNAFYNSDDGNRHPSSSANINDNYVDGVSLTHGNPKHHIWTFAAGLDEAGIFNSESTCPCSNNNRATQPPQFVGEDYFCESGIINYSTPQFYFNDTLWDGDGCNASNDCCSLNDPPWFYKQLPQPTTDDIEMRVCRDEGRDNEDIALERVEIYINQ